MKSHLLLFLSFVLLALAGCGDDDPAALPRYFDGGASTYDGGPLLTRLCGDGTVQAELGEECDDDNASDEDGCSRFCQHEYCGDGVTQAGLGEDCDDMNSTYEDGCTPGCEAELCGDGVTQVGLGEECDDGNAVSMDGCSDVCVWEMAVTQSLQVSVLCINALDMSTLDFVADIDVTLFGSLTSGGTVAFDQSATLTAPATFSQLLVDLSAPDPGDVDVIELSLDLTISGADISTLPLAGDGVPLVLTPDPDDNGVGDPFVMATSGERTTLTNDGSPAIEVSLSGFVLDLMSFPILDELTLSVPQIPMAPFPCSIPAHTPLSFPAP